MLAIQAEEGKGSGHPSEPQPPPSTAQPTNKEPIPSVEWDDRVERDTTLQLALDAEAAIGAGVSPGAKKPMGGSSSQTRFLIEKTVKTSHSRRRAKIVVSDDEKDSEDSSKQGRMIEEIDQDAGVTLVTPTLGKDQPKDQLGVFSVAKVLKNVNTLYPWRLKIKEENQRYNWKSQATIIDSAEVRSLERAAEAELDHEGSKRQKTNEASDSVQEQPEEEEKELPQEDLQHMMMVVPVEEVYFLKPSRSQYSVSSNTDTAYQFPVQF
ncbi:hypothetical protein Tco_1336987 [Tanacetum coccineum]